MDTNQNQKSFQFIANDEFLNLLCDRERDNEMNQQEEQLALNKYYNQHQGCEQEQQWIFGINNQEFEMRLEPDNNPFFNQRRDQRSVSFLGAQMLIPPEQPKKPKEKEIIENNRDLFLANQSKSIYLSKISQLLKDSELSAAKQKKSVSPTSKNQQKIARKHTSSKDDDSESVGQNERLAKNRESARNSRKRKKIYVELLENKVAELTEELKNLKEMCQKQMDFISKFSESAEHFQQFVESQQQWLLKAGQLITQTFPTGSFQQNLIDLQHLEKGIAQQTNEMLQALSSKILGASLCFPINHLLEGLNIEAAHFQAYKTLMSDLYSASSNLQDSVESLQSSFQLVFTQQQSVQSAYDRLLSEIDQPTYQHCLNHILEVDPIPSHPLRQKFQKQQETVLESSGGVLQNLSRKLVKME